MNAVIPSTLGGCADRLLELREQKAGLQRRIDQLDEEERGIREFIIRELPKDECSGVMGLAAKATIRSKAVGSVKDWDAFYEHIRRTGDFSLLQRRLGDAALRERWEAGEGVPGVEPFLVYSVSVTKL